MINAIILLMKAVGVKFVIDDIKKTRVSYLLDNFKDPTERSILEPSPPNLSDLRALKDFQRDISNSCFILCN